jgi:hypothetical protein
MRKISFSTAEIKAHLEVKGKWIIYRCSDSAIMPKYLQAVTIGKAHCRLIIDMPWRILR